ncbi:unnamed protein product [Moneuplotes crassus]|uniref:Tetrapyrrole biosynthesis uroporphyrinogen III synthase domain-containing protein n=1 Tax=Euplotes crassus TaxID=5936 RepID=A0AAD2CVX9_EUPCR|nr:unnamed protein product [Moneuplotes crassus]
MESTTIGKKNVLFVKTTPVEKELLDENQFVGSYGVINPSDISYTHTNEDKFQEIVIKLEEIFKSEAKIGVIFTSVNGVKSVKDFIDKIEEKKDLHEKLIGIIEKHSCVVGKKTSKVLKNHFKEPKIVSDTDMLALISMLNDNEEEFEKFIYFCGNKTAVSDKDLPEIFIKIQVYHNEPISFEKFVEDFSKQETEVNLNPDIIVFYSPSGFETFYNHFQEMKSCDDSCPLDSISLISIGKTTEKAIKSKIGRCEYTCPKPTIEHILEGVKEISNSLA